MKKILSALFLSTLLFAFNSCAEEEYVTPEVDPALVYGNYSGTYNNSISSSNLITHNNYQVAVQSKGGNSISIEGRFDNNISVFSTTLSTRDGVIYKGSLDHPDLEYFSFNVDTKTLIFRLYQNNEGKSFEGVKL